MPRTPSKKVGTVPARQGPPRGPVPNIDEISEVIRDHIQTLINSFACPNEKDAAAIRAGRDWQPKFSQIESPEIRREIVCLTRALQIIESTVTPSVPRGTPKTQSPVLKPQS